MYCFPEFIDISVLSLILLNTCNIIIFNSLSDTSDLHFFWSVIGIALCSFGGVTFPCFLCVSGCFVFMSAYLRKKITSSYLFRAASVRKVFFLEVYKGTDSVEYSIFGSWEGTVVYFMPLFWLRLTLDKLWGSSLAKTAGDLQVEVTSSFIWIFRAQIAVIFLLLFFFIVVVCFL